MANGYTNGSYERCMAELRARYSGRGVSVNAKNTAKAQIESEAKSAIASSSDTRITYDRISGISNEYRSGEYKGNRDNMDFSQFFLGRV